MAFPLSLSLSNFNFDAPSSRCTSVDSDVLSFEANRVHCELNQLFGFDSSQSRVLPVCPGDTRFRIVVSVEVLEKDFVVCSVVGVIRQSKSTVGYRPSSNSTVDVVTFFSQVWSENSQGVPRSVNSWTILIPKGTSTGLKPWPD